MRYTKARITITFLARMGEKPSEPSRWLRERVEEMAKTKGFPPVWKILHKAS